LVHVISEQKFAGKVSDKQIFNDIKSRSKSNALHSSFHTEATSASWTVAHKIITGTEHIFWPVPNFRVIDKLVSLMHKMLMSLRTNCKCQITLSRIWQ